MENSIAVNRAFSAQSSHFDADDDSNPVIADLRSQVYSHVKKFMRAGSSILELNSGTGIDAIHFVKQGHHVHATDIADGMIDTIQRKIAGLRIPVPGIEQRLRATQCSYEDIGKIEGEYDYVFSNFGGLNCVADLSTVAVQLGKLVKPGGYVTMVIMPRVCVWEMLSVLKGSRHAFRRWKHEGVMAHIDGQYFRTWYFTRSQLQRFMSPRFTLTESEGLAAISPPPHRSDFPGAHPALYRFLRNADGFVRNTFPFNRWADHVIVTFKKVH